MKDRRGGAGFPFSIGCMSQSAVAVADPLHKKPQHYIRNNSSNQSVVHFRQRRRRRKQRGEDENRGGGVRGPHGGGAAAAQGNQDLLRGVRRRGGGRRRGAGDRDRVPHGRAARRAHRLGRDQQGGRGHGRRLLAAILPLPPPARDRHGPRLM
uniref:Uncharacterized protein n=1 Tax=Aegilops tauschii subsp. strangulata TaxID=200361 RepID=A0A453MHR1_AEGTS